MPTAVETVIETAKSELKYWGGDAVTPLHIAIAVSKKNPEAFEQAFGSDGRAAIESKLRARQYGKADDASSEAVYNAGRNAQGGTSSYIAMAEALRTELDWVFQPAESESAPAADATPVSGDPVLAGSPSQQQDLESAADASAGEPPLVPFEHASERMAERTAQVDELVVMLARQNPHIPLLIGREGSGKTLVLRNLAARLSEPGYSGPLAGAKVVQPRADLRNETNLVYQVDKAASESDSQLIVCIEDLEMLLQISGMGMNGGLAHDLRRLIDHPSARFVFSVDSLMLGQLQSLVPEFVATLIAVDVQLGPSDPIEQIVGEAAKGLAEAHGVTVPEEIVRVAAATRPSLHGPVQPGLGISTIDSACVRALMRSADTVEVHDVRSTDVLPRKIDYEGLCESLRRSVVGQAQVVDKVAARLALTQARLDLRPERPDGVFLFVGPTGVGKTEMAKAISREVFGRADHMIRLDMSEYVDASSTTRLVGPPPGYIGSTEPSSWLTTKINKHPACLLLLDEVEKAHPIVWNTFLQVFDAGRLTDSLGETIDFSQVVVIMTSNLGAEAYSKRTIGFGSPTGSVDQAEADVVETIRRTLSPELINRLDDTLIFRPLSLESIREIAESMVSDQIQRIAGLGYQLTIGEGVTEHLAVTGYDPAFGARHLQRNVDRQLLAPLALAGQGKSFRAELDDGVITWKLA